MGMSLSMGRAKVFIGTISGRVKDDGITKTG
jgi:hypothetical protein